MKFTQRPQLLDSDGVAILGEIVILSQHIDQIGPRLEKATSVVIGVKVRDAGQTVNYYLSLSGITSPVRRPEATALTIQFR